MFAKFVRTICAKYLFTTMTVAGRRVAAGKSAVGCQAGSGPETGITLLCHRVAEDILESQFQLQIFWLIQCVFPLGSLSTLEYLVSALSSEGVRDLSHLVCEVRKLKDKLSMSNCNLILRVQWHGLRTDKEILQSYVNSVQETLKEREGNLCPPPRPSFSPSPG